MCPHCHKTAPIVYRGMVPHCTACDGVRVPFTGSSVNLAGKPSEVGGTVAGVMGALILLLGGAAALMLGLLLNAFVSSAAGLAVGIPLGIVALVLGLTFLFGGRSLRRSGKATARSTQEEAIFALASHRGGILRAADVARSLSIPVEQAEAQLTELARQQMERVTLEVDDDGGLYYRFPGAPLSAQPPRARVRVEAPAAADRFRVNADEMGSVGETGESELAEEEAAPPRARASGRA